MTKKETFRVSVRDLISVGSQKGDLSKNFVSRQRGLEGIREHTRIQALRPKGYEKEVSITTRVEHDLLFLDIFGRIDGMLVSRDQVLVEEIKTSRTDPDLMCKNPLPAHKAQLKCYGHMVVKERSLEKIDLMLTYANPLSKKISELKKTYTARDLEIFFNQTVTTYIMLLETGTAWEHVRNQSIKTLSFPYEDFRAGQRELAEAVYKIIKNKKILFARAPTGTGKTIATLYPAIKSLGLGQIDKIFYLTAKTLGRTVAQKALKDLGKKGVRLKSVILTAKQKICFKSDEICDMDTCSYARAYYTKLNKAMIEVEKHDIFDQALIQTIGRTYEICPFELSLDISLVCDVIVCDLNYAFDPRVYLKRYFDRDNHKVTFLLDEAHNLPGRLRSMYSADLLKSDILKTQKLVRDIAPGLSHALIAMHKELARLKTRYLEKRKLSFNPTPDSGPDLTFKELTDLPKAYMEAIDNFVTKADLWLDQHPESPIRADLIDFYFMANAFLTIARYFDTHYLFFIEKKGDHDINTRLFCMDPSLIFSRLIQRSCSSILFSATFFPVNYYQTILFGSQPQTIEPGTENQLAKTIMPYSIVLPSPFPKENFKLLIQTRVQTTYRTRKRFFKEIALIITQTVDSKKGNYLVFFPSYAFMNDVVEIIEQDEAVPGIQVQTPQMTEIEREHYLEQFQPGSQVTGFAVMGGIFGEGIDLEGDRLIGVIVVGVGLPQICPEQDLIRAYYEARKEDGFFNAYLMPGFNRVMQATGRLIRTETDQGVVVLIDERFMRNDYKALFPDEWHPYQRITNSQQLKDNLSSFWSNENNA